MNDRIRNNGARTGPAQGTQMIKGLSGRSMSGNEFVLELCRRKVAEYERGMASLEMHVGVKTCVSIPKTEASVQRPARRH